MNNPTNPYHAIDCGCARCADRHRGSRHRRHWRLMVILVFYVLGVLIGAAALLNGGVAQ